MSSSVFVFTARDSAPSEPDVQRAVAPLDGVYVEVDVPQDDLSLDTTPAYVASIIGPFRIDVITYRGGNLGAVADLLGQVYSDAPALADTDSDAIFTIPELVVLLRASPLASFHPWADPSKRE